MAMHYSDWHIPISQGRLTLAAARASLQEIGAQKEDIPLIVKLLENPGFSIPGFSLFHGAVDLIAHDYIHILLGRGLLPEDEAFTIGYTMGSTKQVSLSEARLFELITKHLYPQTYKFRDRDIDIFRAALKLAEAADGMALDQVDYLTLVDDSLKSVRHKLGINKNKISAYYEIEQTLYPDSKASRRLLD
ncbi:MAG: hypothetical protein JKX75_05550 [Gammaproteobacteria bacterium]|nr:hypothetical protein [Gammaproteobacteria bacterium]